MTKQDLQTILSSPYNQTTWQQVLIEVFGVKRIALQATAVQLSNNDLAANAYEIANFTTTDERIVGIFEVHLLPKVKIEANKVSIKRILENIYKYDVDAALIVFVDSEKKHWRFSFVSDLKVLNEQTQEIEHKTTEEKKSRKRYTYLLGQNESCRTAAEQFLFLKDKPYTLNDLFEAFNVDKLNKAFFKGYKEHYEKFWRYLNSQTDYRNLLIDKEQTEPSKTEKPIRDFAKKLLGRIVFLYFLQKKGWLGVPVSQSDWKNGDHNFIKNFFQNTANKTQFYSAALVELFFNTLNKSRKNDAFELTNTKIPYLNGGLFDNDLPQTNHFDFPESYFTELFEFFDQYNFTIDENSPDDANVGIDPEMLGHIFENLLEENKDKGAFYTPKAIVQYMCQESLIQYLSCGEAFLQKEAFATTEIENFIRHNERGDAKGFIVKNARKIEELLDNVKICDPAIGSGAFPMGMLHEIFKAKMTLDLTLDPAETKRHIIQNSIYGVDLDKGAVDIARLRFWLALVVDEETPSPLPNLDYKIMQGNSLLESFEGVPLNNLQQTQTTLTIIEAGQLDIFGNAVAQPSHIELLDSKRQDLEDLIDTYFDLESTQKPAVKQQINGIVHEHLHYNVDLKLAEVETKIGIVASEIALISIYETDNKINKEKKQKALTTKQKAHENLQKEAERLTNALVQLDKIQETDERPYFLWHLFFKDVFDQGGFDIVIGNPPYVQLQKMKTDGAVLEKEGYETFTKNGDLYCLFYEQGIRFLRNNGILAYITSNSWLQTQYGENLRKYFTEKSNPLTLLNFENTQLFETAVVEANILLTKKNTYQQALRVAIIDANVPKNIPLATIIDQQGYIQTDLPTDGWSIGNAQNSILKKRFETVGKKLEEWEITIYRGFITGFNEAFIIDEKTQKQLLEANPKNTEIIKPTLRGRDLRKYSYTFGNQWIIVAKFGSNEFLEEEYPAIFSHLKTFEEKLKARGQCRYGGKNNLGMHHWLELDNCPREEYLSNFNLPKIIWGELSDKAKFAFDDENHYVEATTFMMTGTSLKFLLAILNSRAAQWYFEQITTTSGMGTNRWKKYKIEQLPVPVPTQEIELHIETLVNQILIDKKEGKNTTALEAEIDQLVYALYELTAAEIAIVEGRG